MLRLLSLSPIVKHPLLSVMILGSNMEGYYQQVRGLQYYYITKGHGKQDVIFLHGFLGSHAIFLEGLLETDLVHTHRLILMDLLGHGATEGAELHYRFSAKEQVADLAYFIRHHCQKPVILCGYSMGARLALSLAIQHPNLCRGLVLESGHFGQGFAAPIGRPLPLILHACFMNFNLTFII